MSLLPSTTEILFAVGAGDDVVGVTFECDFPAEARSRRIVSTTALSPGLTPAQIDAEVRARVAAGEDLYTLDEGALRDIKPDVVVTQDLCAVCAVDVANVDQALDHLGCRAEVVTVDPMTLDEVLESIVTLGRVTGNEPRAAELLVSLRARLDLVAAAVAGRPRPRIAMLEWTDPPFSAGHWVPDMVATAGATGDAAVDSSPSLVGAAPVALPAASLAVGASVAAGAVDGAAGAVDGAAGSGRAGARRGAAALAGLGWGSFLPCSRQASSPASLLRAVSSPEATSISHSAV